MKDNLSHILFGPGNGRKFMEHAVNFNGCDRRPLQGREEDASKRISNSNAEASFKGLRRELSIKGCQCFFFYFQPFGSNQVLPTFLLHIASQLLRIQLDD